MSSGKIFEDKVIKTLASEIETGEFGFAFAELKPHPKYYSKDRDDYITFDASIEVFRKNATEPHIILIWECKWSHSRSIEVGEIEQFNSQLLQVGSSKFKGIVITNASFQQSALSYAKAHGIGLSRLLDDGQMHRILETFDLRRRVVNSLLAENPFDTEGPFAGMSTSVEFAITLRDLIKIELSDLQVNH